MVQGAQQVGQVAQAVKQVAQAGAQPIQQSGTSSEQSIAGEPRQVVTPPQSKGKAKGSIDLGSLDRVISSLNKDKPRSTQAASEDGTVKIDPQSESKLLASLQDFIDAVLKMHPRFHAAFNNVTVAGNTITLEAPTVALERDLNESHTEICEIAASVAGIDGRLELNVVLNEVEIKLLPVKIEDRYQFIEDLNPRGIKYFIDKFDLTL